MLGSLGEMLQAAGPWAGWAAAGLVLGGGLWLYATDRLISRGRHAEQASHYEGQMALQQENHAAQLDQLRRHMTELLAQATARGDGLAEDRNYWRDQLLEAMNMLSAQVARRDGG